MKVAALVALVGVTACTHDMGAVSTLPSSALAGEHVSVSLADGSERSATVIAMPGGGFVLYDYRGQTIPYGDIKTVSHTSRGYGALEGLGFGALGGAVLGVALGLSDKNAPWTCGPPSGDEWFGCTDRKSEAVILAILLGMVGGLGGTAVGALLGQDDEWSADAKPAATSPIRLQGPPGSAAGLTIDW